MHDVAEAIGVDFIEEALDQLTGRSRKKWAVMLAAFFVGAAVAAFILRRRFAGQADTYGDDIRGPVDLSDSIAP
jgi:hypothetical protein